MGKNVLTPAIIVNALTSVPPKGSTDLVEYDDNLRDMRRKAGPKAEHLVKRAELLLELEQELLRKIASLYSDKPYVLPESLKAKAKASEAEEAKDSKK